MVSCLDWTVWVLWGYPDCTLEALEGEVYACHTDDACCEVTFESNACAHCTPIDNCSGRPFSVGERWRTAHARPGSRWCTQTDGTGSLGEDLPIRARARLASDWAEAALAEHASVASFARHTLELMAVGAPPDLLAGVSAAMQDEIEHAKACLQMAARFGLRIEPGPLEMNDALDDVHDPEAILRRLVIEGCVGETLAAALAEARAAVTTCATTRDVLERIARDEAGHAVLAFRTLHWLVSTRPALRTVAIATFGRLRDARPSDASVERHIDRASAIRFGRLPCDEAARVHARTLADVVQPAAAQILGDVARSTAHVG